MDFQVCVKPGGGSFDLPYSGQDGEYQTDIDTGVGTGIGPFAHVVSAEQAAFLCDGIIDIAAALFGVSGQQLRSAQRSVRSVARVRQIGMYVAHVTLGMTMTAVGLGFGRDKSTVVHACHTIEDMREDADFDAIVARTETIVRIAFRSVSLPGGRN